MITLTETAAREITTIVKTGKGNFYTKITVYPSCKCVWTRTI